jgi:hypothetical protein
MMPRRPGGGKSPLHLAGHHGVAADQGAAQRQHGDLETAGVYRRISLIQHPAARGAHFADVLDMPLGVAR